MNYRILFWFLTATLLSTCTQDTEDYLPGEGLDVGKTVFYRDTWGVPHIYAPSEEAGAYAMGWAQAQDRPEELLKNFLRGIGEIASVEGPDSIQNDVIAKIWDNYGIVKRQVEQISVPSRTMAQAFARGVNDYYSENPQDLPEWWGEREVDEFMVYAFARLFLNSWSIGDGLADLGRGGIQPGFTRTERGSNQWAVSPERSADGAAILLIDPHLSWWEASRFWEFRIHAGNLHGSGFTLAGFPVIGLGHTNHLAWAMTTGGPDTADVYELTLKEDDPGYYFHDDQWRQLTTREIQIEVAGESTRTMTIFYSHHGPIVAQENGKAYALRTAYANQVQVMDVWMEFMSAKDYTGAATGLAMLQLFPQNVMFADSSGNIYYQRTGMVGKRNGEYDWTRPLDGSIRETEWDGFHPSSELVQLLNPPAGYMQNCNIPPDSMLIDSPLQPENFPSYLFSSHPPNENSGWSNPRGARAVELLSTDDSVTIEEAISYAMDRHSYGTERWIETLRNAHRLFGLSLSGKSDSYREGIEDILQWDQLLKADSTGALKYAYWREQVANSSNSLLSGISRKINHLRESVTGETKPINLSNQELRALAEAFDEAVQRLAADTGDLNSSYGQIFRVGRGNQSWPLGGGGRYGLSTLRNVNHSQPRDDKTRWGHSGQTATQIVVMTQPVQSWTVTPIGQSDRPDSPHYSDQAENLFSNAKMKPSWWLPEQLKDHIESKTVLEQE